MSKAGQNSLPKHDFCKTSRMTLMELQLSSNIFSWAFWCLHLPNVISQAVTVITMSQDIWNFLGILQSHNSYSNCGLGSHGTDRLVALVKQKIQKSERDSRTLFGAKITGGGCGGTVCILGRAGIESNNQISEVQDKYSCFEIYHFTAPLQVYSFMISKFFGH